jgi:hypothetical protein
LVGCLKRYQPPARRPSRIDCDGFSLIYRGVAAPIRPDGPRATDAIYVLSRMATICLPDTLDVYVRSSCTDGQRRSGRAESGDRLRANHRLAS